MKPRPTRDPLAGIDWPWRALLVLARRHPQRLASDAKVLDVLLGRRHLLVELLQPARATPTAPDQPYSRTGSEWSAG
ncbi:hypothetical protein OHA25_07740 [Nonomuraea sp. NBC_00507]|uniref:hypothetical protein n=1 Tax=Nonomuraea sp. NBC_00507 TaxID=2976002 RepID=UPI002E18CCF4